nr:hypothetical protein CFP56_30963 [Quercus suber]
MGIQSLRDHIASERLEAAYGRHSRSHWHQASESSSLPCSKQQIIILEHAATYQTSESKAPARGSCGATCDRAPWNGLDLFCLRLIMAFTSPQSNILATRHQLPVIIEPSVKCYLA